MARQRIMQRFARWHIWLGWLVGIPILMWTVTGLYMAARPIEDVRGDQLRAEQASINPATVSFPSKLGEPIRAARLVSLPSGPAWVITSAEGSVWRYSADGSAALSPVVKDEAGRIADTAYAGKAARQAVTYFPPGEAPNDARSKAAVWQATYADGTRVYIDDTTGEVLALRTPQWRLYDVMWGLHIMDLQTRENAHHPILIVFAALSVMGAALGCTLLFRRRKARVKA
ncbi:PepSY domain-containing protein [Croceibacterium sp. LX-88]|uniref:PepSY domain-containing protein n=1 Tax=Croceibacterium selenioxidans TaxID=2838833 RepID=A0ABS5W279_9SPHN|nr:PepSY-associated TM helix domain-containing protein [Croceibacterium selenioxidans]MBT2133350.1 PepSY domain-containing protein [Croceibacterium selenioxidans]